MRELIDYFGEQNSEDNSTPLTEIPKKPGKSTGPRTPAGKAKSCMNRLDHGLRSKKAILPDEDPAEYDALVQAWLGIYEPQDRKEDELVHEIITAHWQLKRCRKRLEEIEFELPASPLSWTDGHQKLYANFSRYRTTAERSFRSEFKEMEALRVRKLREEQIRDKALLAFAKVDLNSHDKPQAKAAGRLTFNQVVEIDVDEDGSCITECYPTNEEIIELIDTKPYTPVLMKRTIIFIKDVPPEYTWTRPKMTEDGENLMAQQKMSWDRWLEIIAREDASGTGHIGPLYSSFR
jgi:hypothetical protein